ncbi:urocortin 3, like [Neosynchiropus ocellatus]
MISLRTALLLSVLCAPSSSLCLRLPADLLCPEPAGAPSREHEPEQSSEDPWGSLLLDYLSSSSGRDRRTSAPANYRFTSRTKLRGQMLRNSLKGDRRSRFTLSLDVPTNIMNVLFDVAKSKNLRAKAAENARLLAHVGRRK